MGSQNDRILIISSDTSALLDIAVMNDISVNHLPTPDPEKVIGALQTWQFKLVVLVPSKDSPSQHCHSKINPLTTVEEAKKFLQKLQEQCQTNGITLPTVLLNPDPKEFIAHL